MIYSSLCLCLHLLLTFLCSLSHHMIAGYLEDNILTRTMSYKTNKDEVLTTSDLTLAKKVLKQKFIIGLFDEIEDSMKRFETFFGFNALNSGLEVQRCQQNEIDGIMERYYNKLEMPNDNEAVLALMEKNSFDLQLYDYARYLYEYQGVALFGISSNSVE